MVDLAPDLALTPVAADDDAALRDWFSLITAARAHDTPADPPPCLVEHRAQLLAGDPGYDERAWLARAGAEVVGVALLTLPVLDNLDNAYAEILVAPAHRRRGVGGRLLAHLAEAARAAGRVRLQIDAREPLDERGPGPAFLAAAGARLALADQRRRLTLPPPEPAALDALAAQARTASAGYELVQWTGDTPPEWLDDVAALVARMSTDAPHDDLHHGPEHYDAARVRAQDESRRARGLRCTVTAAQAPDGRLAAYTAIFQTATVAWHANQGDTIVAPEHRGRRLGMLVKLANLERVRRDRPDLAVIDTYNADSNPWMVAINEAMGFRPHDRYGEWELDL
ncbi:GNAT family N-acetyltransferase [Pseudonocardia kunmingensis]|uniref:Acetyltransferase (GNAT) family protein n=1 Tax=Pseudonocardia kunmingensis TaxID=630975 RepID=A0A543DNQ9_9PSEU|nr:GNAT family N-acetyltransferase [Pseudonocardia kunmingensis]TQM10948.1 acetyltransferase (GNAT) family protein [Pseudonocardia kunmingensis]